MTEPERIAMVWAYRDAIAMLRHLKANPRSTLRNNPLWLDRINQLIEHAKEIDP